ncbi:MAG: methylenetetrahydrofolate reductase [Magnetococcales bacterium]|nr:methylenetetrahydrofolate reductase [Magnetococcales bacterium]
MTHPPPTKKSNRYTTRISIELVPRDRATLKKELAILKDQFAGVSLINIPDLTRFELRAWEGCVVAREYFTKTIPHIRAIDIDPQGPIPMKNLLVDNEINEILIVTGDPHTDPDATQYEVNAVDIIRKFRQEMPHLKIYAAIDQYRSGFQKEMHYLWEKQEAGADGFFTQPFFDLRFMEIYGEILAGKEVFWGISPVTSEKSKAYWEKRNCVVFPKGFMPTLEWNKEFASQALQFARKTHTDIYFMPIRIDLAQYLKGVIS